MAQYDTAAEIIAQAAVEIGLSAVSDPFASQATEQVQLRTLLTTCGRELALMYQWQQMVKSYSFNTGAVPVADGIYQLPSDFGYMVNQTGWTPTAPGLGLPLGGPLSEQIWSALVNTNLAASTIYVSFKITDGTFQVLPAPAPANIEINFVYVSRNWVRVNGVPATTADKVANAADVILYDPTLVAKMLVLRYKQAKGLDANASLEQFTNMFSAVTGINVPAPVLSVARTTGFPYLNTWTNVPQGGYGL